MVSVMMMIKDTGVQGPSTSQRQVSYECIA
jgi:hypothetical protein